MKIKTEKEFMEALRLSSRSLYNDLTSEQFSTFRLKRKKKIFESVVNYYIRACSRPTPFGLFSHVGLGEFKEKDRNVSHSYAQHAIKEINPDMEWLFQLVNQLENDYQVIKQLNIKVNHLTYIRDDRLFLSHSYKHDKENLPISIKFNNIVAFIYKKAKNFISFQKLCQETTKEFQLNDEDVGQFMFSLIRADMLVTSLRPIINAKERFSIFITELKKVEGCEWLANELNHVSKLMLSYKNTTLGEGINILKQIEQKMKQINKSSHYLKIDYIDTKSEYLSKKDYLHIRQSAYLQDLLAKKSQKHLDTYKQRFLEKYGNREVRILELMDDIHGLGSPYSDSHTVAEDIIEFQLTKKEQLLLSWYSQAMMTGNKEIELTNSKIKQLKNVVNRTEGIHSLSKEIYFTPIKEINEEKLFVNNVIGSNFFGKTFSRFLHYFNNKKLIYKQNHSDTNFVIAGINHYATTPRANNILLGHSLGTYEINLETNSLSHNHNIIYLDDLFVGLSQNKFYLYSKRLDKMVIPIPNNMFNATLGSDIYRLLVDIGEEKIGNFSTDYWGPLSNAAFLPRITYKNVIISPKIWNLYLSNYNEYIDLEKSLNHLLSDYHVPRYVYLLDSVVADQKVLLDLQHDYFKELLIRKLQTQEVVTLFETGFQTLEQNNVLTEYVVGLHNNTHHIKTPINLGHHKNHHIEIKKRSILPFEKQWIFLKLYIDQHRQEDFIFGPLNTLDKQLKENNLIKKSYFIRYKDNEYGYHIRYRIKLTDATMSSDTIQHFNRFYREHILSNYSSKYVIDTYEPEYERYLGEKLFPYVENYFCLESENILRHLPQQIFQGEKRLYFGVYACFTIFKALELTLDEQMNMLENTRTIPLYSKEFRKEKNNIIKYVNLLEDNCLFHIEYPALKKFTHYMILDIRSQLLPYYENMDELFIMSVIHMFINRVFGINRDFEFKIYSYTGNLLKSMKYRLENKHIFTEKR